MDITEYIKTGKKDIHFASQDIPPFFDLFIYLKLTSNTAFP